MYLNLKFEGLVFTVFAAIFCRMPTVPIYADMQANKLTAKMMNLHEKLIFFQFYFDCLCYKVTS